MFTAIPGAPLTQCCSIPELWPPLRWNSTRYITLFGEKGTSLLYRNLLDIYLKKIIVNRKEFLVNDKSWFDILPQWIDTNTFYCRLKLLCLAYICFSNIVLVEKTSLIIIYKIDHITVLSLLLLLCFIFHSAYYHLKTYFLLIFFLSRLEINFMRAGTLLIYCLDCLVIVGF